VHRSSVVVGLVQYRTNDEAFWL